MREPRPRRPVWKGARAAAAAAAAADNNNTTVPLAAAVNEQDRVVSLSRSRVAERIREEEEVE